MANNKQFIVNVFFFVNDFVLLLVRLGTLLLYNTYGWSWEGGVGGRVKGSMKKPFFLFNILCSFFLEF